MPNNPDKKNPQNKQSSNPGSQQGQQQGKQGSSMGDKGGMKSGNPSQQGSKQGSPKGTSGQYSDDDEILGRERSAGSTDESKKKWSPTSDVSDF